MGEGATTCPARLALPRRGSETSWSRTPRSPLRLPCGLGHPIAAPPGRRWPMARGAAGGPLDDFDAQFESMVRDMDRMQRRMDAEMDHAMRESAEAQIAARRRLLESDPGVRIERREEMYSYSESVVISSGGLMARPAPAPALGSLGVFAAALAICLYAVGALRLSRNFDSTAFEEGSRWRLSALWPALVLASPKFRRQFWAAVGPRSGEKPAGAGTSGGADAPTVGEDKVPQGGECADRGG